MSLAIAIRSRPHCAGSKRPAPPRETRSKRRAPRAAPSPGDDLARIVRRAIEKAGLKASDETASPLAALAAARASLDQEKKPDAAQMETLSLAETAAVLDEAAKRVGRLSGSIDATLAAIATSAKETCVCAY